VALRDHRDVEISGATPLAREAFERALDAQLSWRAGAEAHLQQALLDAPGFTMAHVLNAYLSLCSRDRARVLQARSAYATAAALPATERERLHLTAIAAGVEDDFESFKATLGRLLEQHPRDVLALQIGHALDYLTGDMGQMDTRVAAVLPAWSNDLPGYHAVLAMQAFSEAECGRYAHALDRGHQALELNPWDARAHHALTHVYEMTGQPLAGLRWMRMRRAFWADTVVATHCWWHSAVFHLALGEIREAVELYDRYMRGTRCAEIGDLIDASALLWRLELLGGDAGRRWQELAAAWKSRSGDAYCTFNDLHAMLAHVGAQNWRAARQLETALLGSRAERSRYGETTRLVGLRACRAIIAFGRGQYERATQLIGALPASAHRLGGSQAQRNLLYLTRLEARRRVRRPTQVEAA
jgi:tetratricopeptide (TPR) repeat protein